MGGTVRNVPGPGYVVQAIVDRPVPAPTLNLLARDLHTGVIVAGDIPVTVRLLLADGCVDLRSTRTPERAYEIVAVWLPDAVIDPWAWPAEDLDVG